MTDKEIDEYIYEVDSIVSSMTRATNSSLEFDKSRLIIDGFL